MTEQTFTLTFNTFKMEINKLEDGAFEVIEMTPVSKTFTIEDLEIKKQILESQIAALETEVQGLDNLILEAKKL